MADALFADPSLAAVYDVFEGDRDDLTVYLDIAEELGADSVLDVGCGTGSLAILLADSGRTVVDPAEASLEIAKSKDPTRRITWVHGDATAVPALGADLAEPRRVRLPRAGCAASPGSPGARVRVRRRAHNLNPKGPSEKRAHRQFRAFTVRGMRVCPRDH